MFDRKPKEVANGGGLSGEMKVTSTSGGGHDLGPIRNDARVRDVTAKLITQLFRRMVVKVSCLFE
jgi:hypothetical protein